MHYWGIHTPAGDTAGIVGDNVDDPIAGVVCDVVKEQAEADDDVTLGQRAGMLAGTTLQGTSQFVPDEIGAGIQRAANCLHCTHRVMFSDLYRCKFPGAMDVVGGVIHDQATADPDASIQQRLAIGVGELVYFLKRA